MKHTQGKWTIRDTGKVVAMDRFIIECDTNIPGLKGQVASCGYLYNAALIAAAPELLEACKSLMAKDTDNIEKVKTELFRLAPELKPIFERVIAKAERSA